jgi:hypothetical protein
MVTGSNAVFTGGDIIMVIGDSERGTLGVA